MFQSKSLRLTLAALSVLALRAGVAQTISIVSGNGQLTTTGISTLTKEPMLVVVRDAAGNPLPDWPVTWVVTSVDPVLFPNPVGQPSACETRTSPRVVDPVDSSKVLDPGGQAKCWFQAFSSTGSSAYAQSIVRASALAGPSNSAVISSVDFTVTTLNAGPPTYVPSGQPQFIYPLDRPTVFSGQAGVQDTTPIRVYMAANGQPIKNVGVRLVMQPDPATGKLPASTIACAAPSGIAMTGDDGYANCYPIYGGKAGSGRFTITVGGAGYLDSPDWDYRVDVGPPANIRMIAGENQPAAPPNTELTGTLVAQVEDAAGNILPNVPVVWSVNPPGAATLINASNASDPAGKISARVRLGAIPGPGTITVRTATGAGQYIFHFTVNLVISGLQKVSGEPQEAVVGAEFAQPLVVQVNSNAGPVANATVVFATTSDATVLTPSAVTNAQGQAQTRVRAGNTVGQIVITASIGGQTVSFTLTQRLPGPSISADSFWAEPFFAAGDSNHGRIAPGSVVTIVGAGIASGINGYVVPTAPFGPLPYELAGVTVQFGSSKAPIYHVGNWNGMQFVTVQAPLELDPRATPTPVTVTIRNAGSTTVTIPVVATAPAVFETPMSDGRLRAVAVRPDGTWVSLENKARKGEIIRIYLSGLGQGSPAMATGQMGNDQDVPLPVVGLNGEGVRVVSARYAAGLVGVYEVQIEIPETSPSSNDVTVNVLTFNGDQRVDSNTSRLPIQ